jgi:hypothetical protein
MNPESAAPAEAGWAQVIQNMVVGDSNLRLRSGHPLSCACLDSCLVYLCTPDFGKLAVCEDFNVGRG